MNGIIESITFEKIKLAPYEKGLIEVESGKAS